MPIVALMGARQTGKSTLVRSHPGFANYTYLTLDTSDIRAQAKEDPRSLLRRATNLVLDEIQRDPDLVIALKEIVDELAHSGSPARGRFVITGSANLLEMKKVRESLAGRAIYSTLWPMTRLEQLAFGTAGLWSELFTTPPNRWPDLVRASINPADDWKERALTGGYPAPALQLTSIADRSLWFRGYVDTYLDRDLRDLAAIGSPLDMRRLMRIACHRIGQVVNRNEWAMAAGIAPTTAYRYLDLLEQSYLLLRIDAFAVNRGKRLIKSPKAYWSDTGLALHLADDPPLTGFHFENMVLCDLIAWRDSLARRPTVMHWRTVNQDEVDFVVEQPGGALLAIECKAGPRPTHEDAKGLRLFLEEYPDAVGGLLVHGGTETFWITDRVLAAPWWRLM